MTTDHTQLWGTQVAIRPLLPEHLISLCMAHGEGWASTYFFLLASEIEFRFSPDGRAPASACGTG
jgi:hypothetical protein